MNLHEFRVARDEIALASMRERGRKLKPAAESAWKEVQRLRRWRETIKTFEIAKSYNLTPEQFKGRMRVISLLEKVQGKLDDAYEKWADLDTELNNILRDPRYIAWRTGKQAIHVTADDMMGAMGLRRASGQ